MREFERYYYTRQWHVLAFSDFVYYHTDDVIVESNYELMTREPQKNCKKALYDIFLL